MRTGYTFIGFYHYRKRGNILANQKELDQFLASVERRAYRMAEIATGSADDALDIVQDAMYKLVQKYAIKSPAEWGPLFQTILQSRIMDYHRRNTVRNKYMAWLGGKDEENMVDPLETVADEKAVNPESEVDQVTCMQVLERAVRDLPPRQQQAFMLRALEGLDVAQTASVMKCSQGSVKTHYFRAISVLRERLGDYKI